MFLMNLDCGRRVWLDGLEYLRTYGGLLEGRPDARLNAAIMDQARESKWGKRTVHVIPPVIDDSHPAHPRLPPILLRAWLTCNEPIQPKFMGSDLVVVWFGLDCHNEKMSDIVFQAVRGLPWEQLARDFDW